MIVGDVVVGGVGVGVSFGVGVVKMMCHGCLHVGLESEVVVLVQVWFGQLEMVE